MDVYFRLKTLRHQKPIYNVTSGPKRRYAITDTIERNAIIRYSGTSFLRPQLNYQFPKI